MNAIRKAFQKGLMVLDGGVTDAIVTFLENVVDWFFGKIINDFKDYVILACLIRIEYAIRSGSLQIMNVLSRFLKNKMRSCCLLFLSKTNFVCFQTCPCIFRTCQCMRQVC